MFNFLTVHHFIKTFVKMKYNNIFAMITEILLVEDGTPFSLFRDRVKIKANFVLAMQMRFGCCYQ